MSDSPRATPRIDPRSLSFEELLRQNELLFQEVLVSRRAAEITAGLMAEQFTDMERINGALERANETLQRVSSIDGLTEIPNRRYYDEMLDKEWRRCRRNHHPLSLIILDIDHFKLFNDRYGHTTGDQCLKQVAGALQWIIHRATDSVARYGGEEFVYLLPESNTEAATSVANSARQAVEQLEIPHAESRAAAVVTVSLGVASVIPNQSNLASNLARAADRALYAAKDQGRNRLTVHPTYQV